MAQETRWVVGLATVVFDIDTGQRIDQCFPPGVLTDEEMHAVAFHSFGDSMSLELHAKTSVRDTCFWFRVKRTHGTRPLLQQTDSQQPAQKPLAPVDTYLYGYVFCRQRQDETLRRGGEQVSVVVLSEHPFSSVLRPLSQIVGPMVLSSPSQAAMLRQAYTEVSTWNAPTAQGSMQLTVNYTTITARLPPFDTLPHPSCLLAVDNGLNCRLSNSQIAKAELAALVGSTGVKRMASGSTHEGSVSGGNVFGRNSLSGPLPVNDLLHQGDSTGINGVSASQQRLSSSSILSGKRLSSAQASGLPEGTHNTDRPSSRASGNGDAPSEDLENMTLEDSGAGQGLRQSVLRVPHPGSDTHVGSPSGSYLLNSKGRSGELLPSTFMSGAIGQPVTLRSVSRTSLHSVESQSSIPSAGPSSASQVLPTAGSLPLQHATSSQPASVAPSRGHTTVSSSGQLAQTPLPPFPQGTPPTQLILNLPPSGSGALSNSPALRAPTPGTSTGTPPGSVGIQKRLSTGLMGGGDSNNAASGAFHDADIFTPMQPHVNRLWQLWEMMLLSRPLLVMGPSPADCSGAVAALISLVAPLPYAPDFRPYYTIHDSAFAALAAGALPGPQQRSVPCLIGATNLYFVKALTQWPSILSVGKKETSNAWAPESTAASTTLMSGAVKALRQRAQGAQVLLGEHMESLWSSYRPVTRPDHTLLVRLLQPKPGDAKSKLQRIASVNSEALRRHFHELTTDFLKPFARYFEPGPDGYLPAFDQAELLFTIRYPAVPHSGALFERVNKSVESLVELYSRFVASVNFREWFVMHRQRLQHLEAPIVAAQAPTEAPAKTNGLAWFSQARKHIGEVELVQMYTQLDSQLRDAMSEVGAAACEAAHLGGGGEDDDAISTVRRLQQELTTLFLGIGQEDMQLLCISAPVRRDLLLSAAKQVCTSEQMAQIRRLTSLLDE